MYEIVVGVKLICNYLITTTLPPCLISAPASVSTPAVEIPAQQNTSGAFAHLLPPLLSANFDDVNISKNNAGL
jgi:hypothetical protein